MAVFLNATAVKINAIDITSYVTSATLTQSADELEITSMGDSARKYVAALQTGKLDLEFLNDFAASQVCATLQSAIYTTVTAKLCPSGTTINATNPLYTVSILVNNLTPIAGAAGEMSKSSLSFTCNSTIVQTITGTW
ncbi:hypothetical protein UFOVP1255_14 [uncultured Caudovirales phage]|uniref:Uncharacterized protein n=1 Tax=uncultured Caudovirales phage TaxID=2100421 RepID=A0A6J5SNW7_9CAUD|nr:hypothetical protein UFOVP973_9 [uncultured Caudovirales phage]CAB4194050.1 hypothetical protein UFOVP1255_14 [uncultured Caudovirales phage]CAB4216880.1 hypothetical protein UFOVP1496_9 [uncultured Caudovirales phage]